MTTTASVLVIEDEPAINDAVTERLRANGYHVTQAHTGPDGLAAFEAEEPDVVIIDWMLPGFDGLEVCRRIHATRPVPVLMLTARDDEADIVVGLAVGADDYLTKPFRMRELLARVEALLRRVRRAAELVAEASPTRQVTVGDLTIDHATRAVDLAGKGVHLTPTEFDLLWVLASEPERVWSRAELLESVWGWTDGYGTRSIDSHIKALRAKIGTQRVRTVHGVGYALETQ